MLRKISQWGRSKDGDPYNGGAKLEKTIRYTHLHNQAFGIMLVHVRSQFNMAAKTEIYFTDALITHLIAECKLESNHSIADTLQKIDSIYPFDEKMRSELSTAMNLAFVETSNTHMDTDDFQTTMKFSSANTTSNNGMFVGSFSGSSVSFKQQTQPKPVIAIPEAFICPITLEVMTKPYICTIDGNSYEEKDIREALNKFRRTPLTNIPMKANQTVDEVLIINRNLTMAIDSFRKEHPECFNTTNKMSM